MFTSTVVVGDWGIHRGVATSLVTSLVTLVMLEKSNVEIFGQQGLLCTTMLFATSVACPARSVC
jgi:hypothetical protein